MATHVPSRSSDLPDPANFDLLDFLPFGGSFDLPAGGTVLLSDRQRPWTEREPQDQKPRPDARHFASLLEEERGRQREEGPANHLTPAMLDASSNSGDLPDMNSLLGLEGHVDATPLGKGDGKKNREKNRAAQKRFRQRQKTRMASSAQQVQDLANQMQTLALEKERLEAQNRVLQHTVKLSSRHIQDTNAEKEAHAKQQERMLLETSQVYWRGLTDVPVTVERVKSVTMGEWIQVFEAFLGRYAVMLENGGKDPSTPAGIQLQNTVLDRRQEEARAAMFSDWASAAYAWNKEETAQGLSPPSTEFWTHVLERLEVSAEQVRPLLEARRRLLTAVSKIRQDRERHILELGLALLRKQEQKEESSFHERRLRDSLELEREAVLDFMYTTVDDTLHPWQEAAADLYSHPWHPDLWAICNILAQRQGGEPEDISDKGRGTASLLPHFSAAEMLWTPILARGAGLQLKRVLVSRETPADVLAAGARPLPTIARMRGMNMYDLYCGKHLEPEPQEGDNKIENS